MDPDDRPSIALDLSRMASVQALDVPSSLVTVGPGMRGPALEEALSREGLTFGHLPQSWEFATLGGYAATRSAGQASTGVGRFDELVAGLTLATPSGVLELGHPPATAAGPDLLGLALGSEGALGVITELTAAGATQAARRRTTRAGPSAPGRPGWPRCSASPATTCCPTSSGSPTPTRRGPTCSWPPAPGPGPCAAACAPGVTGTAACWSWAGRACPTWSAPASAPRRPCCGRAARSGWAGGSASPGRSTGSRARTCATGSWTAGCWSRRWRPRPPGRRCPRSTTPSAGPCASH